MDRAQAEALSGIFSEMATKSDLHELEERVERRMSVLEEKLSGQMAHLKSDLTWRMIAIVGFFGTFVTILNAFIT